jgi:hypothetical protein
MTTELSTFNPAPLSWVESLFARMTACYGSLFADMWRDADMNLVKQMWAAEMGRLTKEELKHGYESLMSLPMPPTLPKYVQLCKAKEKPVLAHLTALPAPKSELSREKAKEMLDKLGASEILKSKTDHKLWAKRIIARSKHPLHGLSRIQISIAKEVLSIDD